MNRKVLFVLVLVGLFGMNLLMGVMPVHAAATKPQLDLYGMVQKDIINLNDVLLYQDEDGNNQSLPYVVDDNRNITIGVGDIKWDTQFLNATIVPLTLGSAAVDGYAQYLTDSNGIPYVLVYAYNVSNSPTVNAYLVNTLDYTFETNAYFVFCTKIFLAEGSTPRIRFDLKLLDVGGEDHYLTFIVWNSSGTNNIRLLDTDSDCDDLVDDVQVDIYEANIGEYYAYQFKISDLFTTAGLNTEITKIEAIHYRVVQSTSSLGDNEIKGIFKYAFISNKLVKINDKIVNGTQITYKASDGITTTRDVIKIADAQIPFKYSPTPDHYADANALTIKYSWDIVLPDDAALSFSNLELNFTMGSGNVTEFWVNGEDKYNTYKDLDAGDEVTLLTSMTPGTLYNIKVKIAYTATEYDELVTEKHSAFIWYDPSTWSAWFWGLLATIAGFFSAGLAAYFKRRQRKAATKVANKFRK